MRFLSAVHRGRRLSAARRAHEQERGRDGARYAGPSAGWLRADSRLTVDNLRARAPNSNRRTVGWFRTDLGSTPGSHSRGSCDRAVASSVRTCP